MTNFYQKFLTLVAFLKVLFGFGPTAPARITKLGRAPDGSIRLAFCGKMKSGKDTAANTLKALHDGTIVHIFASGYRWTERLLFYPLFGAKIDPENKTKLERLALQWVGHWGRVVFGKDVWLNRTLKLISKTPGNVYVVGVRYPNEVKRLRDIGIQSVWIERSEAARLDAGAFNVNHETETALDGYAFDFVIPNDKDLTTFKRRVECYAYIDSMMEVVKQGRSPIAPVTTFMDGGAGSHGFQTVDDGVDHGWKPTADDDKPKNFHDLEAQAYVEGKNRDQLLALYAAAETELSRDSRGHDRGAPQHRYFDKYNVTSHEIAQEVRRFADTIDYNLKVSDGQVANETIRKTLHSILDNRPINGKPDLKNRDEVIAECQALAASVGEEFITLTETPSEIRAALEYYRNRPTLQEEQVTNQALVLLTKERARREAWNQERRYRRAQAKLDKARKANRGSKLKADKLKAAAKRSRR